MAQISVAQFASELKVQPAVLLEQLRAAGVSKSLEGDLLSDLDKSRLLEYLRRSHGQTGEPKNRITLTRKQTTEIKKADSSGKARTIQVEVRKKRVFVKREPGELQPGVPEAALAPAEFEAPPAESAVPAPHAEAPAVQPDVLEPAAAPQPVAENVPEPPAAAPEPSATATEPAAALRVEDYRDELAIRQEAELRLKMERERAFLVAAS
jgi:translation initiation factor IF-2